MNACGILYSDVNGVFILKLKGELRFDVAVAIEQTLQIADQNPKLSAIYFDLLDATLVDSTILGTILRSIMSLEKSHQTLKDRFFLWCENESLIKVFECVGALSILTLTKVAPELMLDERNMKHFEIIEQDKETYRKMVHDAHALLAMQQESNQSFSNVMNITKNY